MQDSVEPSAEVASEQGTITVGAGETNQNPPDISSSFSLNQRDEHFGKILPSSGDIKRHPLGLSGGPQRLRIVRATTKQRWKREDFGTPDHTIWGRQSEQQREVWIQQMEVHKVERRGNSAFTN